MSQIHTTLIQHYAGSKAYGTNIATSDTDIRGIFVAQPEAVRTPWGHIEQISPNTGDDIVLYELNKYMRLALQCNPNIIETMWIDEGDIIQVTPEYQLLRSHAPELLNISIADTTMGYALSQLHRIKGHNKWITQAETGVRELQFLIDQQLIASSDVQRFMRPDTVNQLKFGSDASDAIGSLHRYLKQGHLNILRSTKPEEIDYTNIVQVFDSSGRIAKSTPLRTLKNGYKALPYGDRIYGVYKDDNSELFAENGSINDGYTTEQAASLRDSLGIPAFIMRLDKDQLAQAQTAWSDYHTWKTNRNATRSALEEKYGYDCYTDDTEFLTNTGWKRFDDVLDTDNLATFNQFSKKIEYQAPTERIDSTFTGNLYNLTGYHADSMVTSNHNMFVRPYSRTNKIGGTWGFERAAELSETFDTLNVIQPRKTRQLLPSDFPHELLNHVDILNYMRLVGWYVSDGTMSFDDKGNVKSMMISQSKPQSKLTQNLSRQINQGKIKCNHYEYPPGNRANYPENRWVFDRQLSTLIYNDCGHTSAKKRLPKWCFFLTKREMTTLLIALLQGDGTKRNHQDHTYVYYTVNKDLADDVQRLAFLCGYETSQYGPYDIDSTFNTENQMYHVHINMRAKETRRHIRSAAVKAIPVVNHRVVCFMVPNYTLVTRRNGQIGLHGNTKHAMHLVRLLRMGEEALSEGIIHVKRPDAQELLAIRNGKFSYDELLEYADDYSARIRELKRTTSLRKKPNVKLATSLILQIQDSVWSKV